MLAPYPPAYPLADPPYPPPYPPYALYCFLGAGHKSSSSQVGAVEMEGAGEFVTCVGILDEVGSALGAEEGELEGIMGHWGGKDDA